MRRLSGYIVKYREQWLVVAAGFVGFFNMGGTDPFEAGAVSIRTEVSYQAA